jgi:integrase
MGKPKLKHGFWWRDGVIHTRDPVTGKRTSTRTHDPRAAELWRAERERLAANPAYAASLTATVSRWVVKTIEHKAAQRRAGTVHMYTTKLGHSVRLFGADAPLANITAGAIDDYITARRREGAKNNTIARELTCLRQMLRLAKRAGEFAGDLDQVMPVGFSAEYKPVERVLDMADFERLWSALQNDEHRAWVAMALTFCADQSDIERMRQDDHDPERNDFLVRGTKTATREARLPVLPHMETLFRFALPRLPVSWPRASKALGEACKRAGIPHISPKDLRRTGATLLAEHGADISLISRFLRHGSDTMARKVYARVRSRALGQLLAPTSQAIVVAGLLPAEVASGSCDGTNASQSAELDQEDSENSEKDATAPWRNGRRGGFKRQSEGASSSENPGDIDSRNVAESHNLSCSVAKVGTFPSQRTEAYTPGVWALALAAESLGLGGAL